MIVTPHFPAILRIPFAENGGGENGSFRIGLMRLVAPKPDEGGATGNHNNIKHQSRVPRDASASPEFQPKEKLC
jgi:hypothetical protein